VATRFEPNPDFDPRGWQEVEEIVFDIGEEMMDTAIEIARQHEETGEFARSIQSDPHRSRTDAPVYRIYSDDPGALSIEFGTSKMRGIRALGRAAGRRY
jgi:hypothetical protein